MFSNEPEYIRKAIDGSLQRLKTDYVDLWYWFVHLQLPLSSPFHPKPFSLSLSLLIPHSPTEIPPPVNLSGHRFDGKVPVESIVSTMASAVHANKFHYLGLSECSSATLRRAHAIHPIHAVQIEYSPFTLDTESAAGTHLLSTCRDLGTATVAYSPLGRGMLTGRYKSPDDFEPGDWRRQMPRFLRENFEKNLVLVETLEGIARRKGCTVGQLVLAWLLAQGEDVFPIPGTKKVGFLEENLGALGVVLGGKEVAEIRGVVEAGVTSGERYAGVMAKLCFADTPELAEGVEAGD